MILNGCLLMWFIFYIVIISFFLTCLFVLFCSNLTTAQSLYENNNLQHLERLCAKHTRRKTFNLFRATTVFYGQNESDDSNGEGRRRCVCVCFCYLLLNSPVMLLLLLLLIVTNTKQTKQWRCPLQLLAQLSRFYFRAANVFACGGISSEFNKIHPRTQLLLVDINLTKTKPLQKERSTIIDAMRSRHYALKRLRTESRGSGDR